MGLLSRLFSGGPKIDIQKLLADGALLIDARSPDEYAGGHIDGAANIPHDRAAARIGELEADQSRTIVVYCHSGGRSAMAARALKKVGYENVVNGGGITHMRHALKGRSE